MNRCTVRSHSRLHMGFLDLNGNLGRKFGSIGVALENPAMVITAEPASSIEARGPDSARAIEYAERFYSRIPFQSGDRARLCIESMLPPHVGLGSGTQLALTVGKALSLVHGVSCTTADIAAMMCRGKRPGAGIALFDRGGLVIDGGRRTDGKDTLPPLLFHSLLPESWRFVVAIPVINCEICGEKEVEAFHELPDPPVDIPGSICREVLMRLLPAVEEEDLAAFGASVTSIQKKVGDCFFTAQSGRYASSLSGDIVEAMRKHGASGVGQSSWGPAVYGIVEGDIAAHELTEKVRTLFDRDDTMQVFVSRAARKGADWSIE